MNFGVALFSAAPVGGLQAVAELVVPVIDRSSLIPKKNKFNFSWIAPTNISYQVDYSTNLLACWGTFTNVMASTNGPFNFSNTETGGLPPARF